jgi:hypothetical protein
MVEYVHNSKEKLEIDVHYLNGVFSKGFKMLLDFLESEIKPVGGDQLDVLDRLLDFIPQIEGMLLKQIISLVSTEIQPFC